MDSQKIKLFLLVEKYKSFSAVANEFLYTPSAISHMADSLETELGVKLFNRTKKGVSLTDDGRRLYDKFSALAAMESDLMKEAASLALQNRHTLRIGTYSSIALYFLPGILQSFKQEFPSVKATITVDDYMRDWIKKGAVDVILADQLIADDLWQPLLEDEYVAVVPESEFPQQTQIDVKDLYGYTLIKSTEVLLENYLDFSQFADIIEVKSIEDNSLIFMVRQKLGITILPALSINALPAGVKALKLTPSIQRTIGIIYDPKRASWACEQFVRHIKKVIETARDAERQKK